MSDARIASLHLYPIKGCRGIDPAVAQVAATGLAVEGVGDREWMVVDEAGRFLTQRELPRLALVETSIAKGRLRLAASPMHACEIELSGTRGAARNVIVWQSEVRGYDAGDAAARWLSDWLGRDVRLVRFDRSLTRTCNPQYAGDSCAHTMFADGYPLLVAGVASLDDLNERLARRGHDALPMNRFRPNIVIAGLAPYDEDHVDTLTIGDVVLRCVKPCARCTVTTTDQRTALAGVEPLRTLGEYRMDARLDGVTFGMNAIVVAGGVIAPGSPVEVKYRFQRPDALSAR